MPRRADDHDPTSAVSGQTPTPAPEPTPTPDATGATGAMSAEITPQSIAATTPPAGAIARAVFSAGERLADRYRIVRLVARGGMGEVYEAEDEALHERVALKTVSAVAAMDAQAVERFKREIQLARKVTHPNVCRMFELGLHRGAPGAEPTLFLTMELLEGETLAQRIRRAGPMAAAEALPLVRQMAAGLAAAHEAGIVHRDFKSANVVLAHGRRADAASETAGDQTTTRSMRAVVTDFGIAYAPGGPADAGAFMGSPAYMAPEQVSGGAVTASSDLYAMGVVMFEMVTGRVPFQGRTATDAALQRVNIAPPSPRQFAKDLDPRWAEAILRCLERDPARRFASVAGLVAALQPAPPRERRAFSPAVKASLALAAVALAAMAAIGIRGRRGAAPPEAPVPWVAVLGLHGASAAQPDWVSIAFSEALHAALGAAPGTPLVPPADVERAKLQLGLASSASFTRESLERVRRLSGAERVVAGGYARGEGTIALDLSVQSARTGEALARLFRTGPEAGLAEMALAAAAELSPRLGLPPPGDAARRAVAAALPKDPAALRAYAEGLFHLRRSDPVAARGLLERAAAAEPGFPRVHGALAELWAGLEDRPRAAEEARLAHRLAAAAGDPEAAQLEALLREAEGAWAEAARLLKRRFQSSPTLDAGLRLVNAEVSGGDLAAAGATLAALRALPAPLRDDPRIDLVEATLTWSQDPERSEAAVERSVREARARGARAVLADALARRSESAWVRGDLATMVSSVEEARKLHAQLGDRKGLANDVNVLGAVRYQQGRLREALRLAEEATALQRELGNREQLAINLGNQGMILVRLADLAAARLRFEESRELRGPDDPIRGVPEMGLGWIAALEGRLEDAERLYRGAAPRIARTNEPHIKGYLAAHQAELFAARGDLAAARRTFEEARAHMSRVGVKLLLTELRLAEAPVMLAEGRAAEADAVAQAALEDLRALGASDFASLAHALRARAALSRGDTAAAQTAIAEAAKLEAAHDHRLVALAVGVEQARVRCAAGTARDANEAAVELRRIAGEGARSRLFAAPLEAEIAMAGCEARAGRGADARRRLQAVERTATRRGHLLVAAEARRAALDLPTPAR